ncbi:Mitochondrial export Som1 protein [Rutstroemia sp. NJR-2017a BBW]|nr:Mitochondrial export Som1 protein [Rutstroemia sp. NJR-2017a BBW]
MTPPILSFPPSRLPHESRYNAKNEFRKGFDGDLQKCELLEMMQYECDVKRGTDGSVTREGRVVCWPVERWFRRCRDREGTFMVETTVWEGEKRGRERLRGEVR